MYSQRIETIGRKEIVTTVKVQGPANPSPPRRRHSIRRTSSIDSIWVNGRRENRAVAGRARDLLTMEDFNKPAIVAEDTLWAEIQPDRSIVNLNVFPDRSEIATLIGTPRRKYSRWQISEVMPNEVANGTPLFLLLDDLVGAFVVEHVASGVWSNENPTSLSASSLQTVTIKTREEESQTSQHVMVGTCAGLAIGSPAINDDGTYRGPMGNSPVEEIGIDADAWSWHELPEITQMSHRRARRLDVWREGDVIHAATFFQDSFTHPSGQRFAAHEYNVFATADFETGKVLSVTADPRILPLDLCPMATLNVHRLIGHSLFNFRSVVNEQLPGQDGCTHMNDTLRALAEIPMLAQKLPPK